MSLNSTLMDNHSPSWKQNVQQMDLLNFRRLLIRRDMRIQTQDDGLDCAETMSKGSSRPEISLSDGKVRDSKG